MIDLLKGLLGLSNKSIRQEPLPQSNKIEFIFDGKKQPNIKISIIDTDRGDAEALADLIHSLVTGQYNNDIIEVLLSLSQRDEIIKSFVTKVLIAYSLHQTNTIANSINSSPLIKPSEFQKQKF